MKGKGPDIHNRPQGNPGSQPRPQTPGAPSPLLEALLTFGHKCLMSRVISVESLAIGTTATSIIARMNDSVREVVWALPQTITPVKRFTEAHGRRREAPWAWPQRLYLQKTKIAAWTILPLKFMPLTPKRRAKPRACFHLSLGNY